MYNILIGGAAGQGIETTAAILQKFFTNSGYHVFAVRDFMSRVRGGHNFTLLRISKDNVYSHSLKLDGIVAFNEETVQLHLPELKPDGFLLCDSTYTVEDNRKIAINMVALSKELGNPRFAGMIAMGALLKLFGEDLSHADKVLRQFIKEQFVESNMLALNRGQELVESRIVPFGSKDKDKIILSGNQALALGAIAAGLRFYSAYPMSPSTTILEYLASKGDAAGIVVEQAEDEIAAINMAIGASFAGAPAMTGTSGGGFCLKVEALGLSGMAEIPLVVVDVQRPGPVTGLPTRTEQSDLKFVISASQGEFPRMVIALRNHTDAFYQTARALDIAERYQIPVIILSDQYLGDSTASVEPYDLSKIKVMRPLDVEDVAEGEYLRFRYTENGISPRLIPGKTKNFVTADSDEHDEFGRITEDAEVRTRMMDKRMSKLESLKLELQEPEYVGAEDCDTLIVGWGSTYGPIIEAVSLLNQEGSEKFGALLFGDIYPLPQRLLKEKASIAKRIVNVEQNATGQLADLIREQTGIRCWESILKYDGRQISGEEIADRIRREVV
ncbi:MAG: 2-oxoacid:ferredoxin oxidoreductase subunit alpha [Firmicutes bacterium]|nr:2-oxoacid:ferredoxin oxidoreductase subunit alpha [Bacillota bacterium]